jgi:hypothetical protein
MNALDHVVKKYGLHLWKARLPIEIPDTDRVTLAFLFQELGFNRGAEVGVEEGKYSEVLCKANPDLHLFCVDPWMAYTEYRTHLDQPYINGLHANCVKRMASYNATLIHKTSMDALEDIPDRSLDFVYLDGNHRFEYVVNDIVGWSRKVRSGGIISGHDWIRMQLSSDLKNNPVHVQPALIGYTDAYRIRPWFLLGTNAMLPGHKRDRARSWMWINP